MPALIETLIEGQDRFELVRDQIAAILVLESEAQQALATAADKDPRSWKLRVFLERDNPWGLFIDDPAQLDASPIVNVTWTGFTPDGASASTVDGGKTSATYQIDCYGYGKSADVEDGGHLPGDQAAGIEAARTVRLVRNILMSGHYTYLGLPRKTVWRRWLQSVTALSPPMNERAAQHVVCARMTLEVLFGETSPQVQGHIINSLFVQVKQAKNGRLYFAAQYGEDS